MRPQAILNTIQLESFVTIGVSYRNEVNPQLYTFKCPKAFNIQLLDLVIVPNEKSDFQFRVCRVERVDEIPAISPNVHYDLRWIVAKIDLSFYLAQLEREAQFVRDFERIQQRRAVAETIAAFRAEFPEGSPALQDFDKLFDGAKQIASIPEVKEI